MNCGSKALYLVMWVKSLSSSREVTEKFPWDCYVWDQDRTRTKECQGQDQINTMFNRSRPWGLQHSSMAQTGSCWICWQAPALPTQAEVCWVAVLQDDSAYRAREATGPWMEDPCSAPPLPTCTLTLPFPLRVTFLHICHSGNGKREGGKEQWRHGKRSTWLTINCVATWRVRKTERERDQRSEEEGERE